MLGVYDFPAHYDWTFAWLQDTSGEQAVMDYWREAISQDAQRHARALFREGFEGMLRYWGHTLREEGAGYTSSDRHDERTGRCFLRLDMYDCPSKGFLQRNGLAFSADYCDHCIGWIEPALEEAGFTADHDHDHAGHCWWEIRAADDPTPPVPPPVSGSTAMAVTDDVRGMPGWREETCDRYRRGRRIAPPLEPLETRKDLR